MRAFIRIKGWETYQHYKDRNPPWIKLHNSMLSSETWVSGTDTSRVLAIAIMMLASRTENNIPANGGYLQRVAYLNTVPDLQPLIDIDFIEIIDENGECLRNASELLAYNASPETEERRAYTTTDTTPETEISSVSKASPEKPKQPKATITTPRGSRFKIEKLPTPWADFCRSERADLDPIKVFARFRDYWIAKPDGSKLDWLATWRNWVRDEKRGAMSATGLQPGAAAYLAQSANAEREVGGERVE